MAKFFDKVKHIATSIKNLPELLNENAALRQLYQQSNICQGLVPGQYYRAVDPGTGNVKGYSCVCLCGKENRIYSLSAIFAQELQCPTCKMEINLLKKIGAVDASGKMLVKVQEIEAMVAKLPVRPVLQEQSGTRFLPSDGGASDDGFYDGPRDDARSRAFTSGDPGSMGPGF